MDGIIEENIYADSIIYEDKKHGEKPPKVPVPKDKYLICHIVFFLIGVSHFLPISFLAAANNFWLYKFKDPLDENTSAENRTTLQTYFASATLIANTVPAFIFGLFNIIGGQKFKITNRFLLTLGIELMVFTLITISATINTDNHQLYFGLVLLGYCTLTAANTVNIVASMMLFPRFPHKYMNTCLAGEGSVGILGNLLNIISISIFKDDVTNSTLLYFIIGTAILCCTWVLTFFTMKSEFFIHSIQSLPEDVNKTMPGKKQIIEVFSKIKFAVVLFAIFVTSYAATHTAVTALVVSEQTDTTWSTNYFSPVMTFFLSDVCMLAGRLMASAITIDIPEGPFLLVSVVRTLVLVPLIWLCNAQPRNHLPVLFPHDYQYGIILATFMLTSGLILNMSILVVPKKVSKEDADVAYTLIGLIINTLQALTSPIGLVIVNVL
uniref:Equilibrative nucleoside transporter 3 n=1 Tax=Dendroctonus ponderosae TaxID=77166 RepID=A0AAR5P749_DENPD